MRPRPGAKRAEAGRVRELGREWARKSATADELDYVARYSGPEEGYLLPTTLIMFMGGAGHVPTSPSSRNWEHFQAGARDVWEEVKPLLAELDDGGSDLAQD